MKRRTLKMITVAFAASLALSLSFACAPGDDEDFDAGPDTQDAAVSDAAVAHTCADFQGQNCTADLDRCEGDLLLYCNDQGKTECNDCAQENAHCALWTSAYGNDCLVGAGQTCAEDFPNNDDDSLNGCDPAVGTCTGGTCN